MQPQLYFSFLTRAPTRAVCLRHSAFFPCQCKAGLSTVIHLYNLSLSQKTLANKVDDIEETKKHWHLYSPLNNKISTGYSCSFSKSPCPLQCQSLHSLLSHFFFSHRTSSKSLGCWKIQLEAWTCKIDSLKPNPAINHPPSSTGVLGHSGCYNNTTVWVVYEL